MTASRDTITSQSTLWVCLGKITKPFGIRGGVRIHLHNADSETLRPGLHLELRAPKECSVQKVIVQSVHGEGRVLFETFKDRNSVEALRQYEVWVRRDDLPPIKESEAYLIDFIGAQVLSEKNGYLGKITEMDIRTPQPIAKVQTPDGRLVEIPFVAGLIVKLSEEENKVWIDEPEGLFSGEAVVVPQEDVRK